MNPPLQRRRRGISDLVAGVGLMLTTAGLIGYQPIGLVGLAITAGAVTIMLVQEHAKSGTTYAKTRRSR